MRRRQGKQEAGESGNLIDGLEESWRREARCRSGEESKSGRELGRVGESWRKRESKMGDIGEMGDV